MFDDDFKLGIWEWAGMAAIALPIILFRLAEFEIIERPPYLVGSWVSMVSLILMAHLAYTVMRGRKDDMIETRRKIRSYFVVGMAIAASLTVLAENLYYGTHPEFVDLFRGAVVLPMVIWAIFWLLSFRSEKLSFEPARPIANPTPTIDPRDQGLHDTLVNLMQNEKAYLEPGLTIRTLAGKLKTPEHQLRALINKGMGYRNFSGFLNHYRIQAVQEAMERPENSRIPVLTLAMDVGFNSLAPFNRAFRQIVGETPTKYRSKISNENNGSTD